MTPGIRLFGFSKSRYETTPPEIGIVPIATGAAGKSTCLDTLHATVRDGLPSGLRFGSDNPLELVDQLEDYKRADAALHASGMTQTLAPELKTLKLQDTGKTVMSLRMLDVVGQVLTYTNSRSPDEQIARYSDYMRQLIDADVLWVLTAPPGDGAAQTLTAWGDEMMIIRAYLIEALKKRKRPCSVVIAISKIDSLFDSELETRRKVDAGVLARLVEPLVDVVRNSMREHVAHAAIFPFSSFGFGKAAPLQAGAGQGTEWVLRDGEAVEPFNVLSILVYSALMGLRMNRGRDAAPTKDICGKLEADLEALKGCFQPVI